MSKTDWFTEARFGMFIHWGIYAIPAAGEWIYVIELKLNKTAEAAMQQIHDKNYPLKFRNRGKKIMLIGANLDSEKGQLTDWITEEYQ